MRVRGRVDDDAVEVSVRLLDLVHNRALVIRLEALDLRVVRHRGPCDQFQQRLIVLGAVDPGLAYAQHIDVRSVDNEYSHRSNSLQIKAAQASGVLPLTTEKSANRSYFGLRST